LSLQASIVSKISKASEFCGFGSGTGSAPPPGSCTAARNYGWGFRVPVPG
jgi:hypothetical protein